MDPRYRAWVALDSVWQFPADLCIVDWLERSASRSTSITDEDLHREGASCSSRTASSSPAGHPEYMSEPMLDASRSTSRGGGRLMYLGGNGFYWIVVVSTRSSRT